MNKSAILAALCLVLIPRVSQAGMVTFSGLVGANGAPFSTYSEGIFTVASTTGSWVEAHNFGNPVPDIFSSSLSSSVTVTSSTSLFTFASVDLGNANTGVPTYQITGFLGGSPVLFTSGSLPGAVGFTTIASPNSSQALDALVISYNLGTTTSYNIDNFVGFASTSSVTVPEPSSLVLIGVGLACVGFRARLRALKRS